MSDSKANIGVIGLAAMGASLARNLARHGNTVAVYNRSGWRTDALMKDHGDEGDFIPSKTLEEFVASLAKPRTAIIMIKAGEPTEKMIHALADLMEPGDIIIDGGNTFFKDTMRREKAEMAARGLNFVGMGVPGGEQGRLLGPSIMPGGSEKSKTPGRSSSRSPPRSRTARRASPTSARTVLATSSRWSTTASSTPTCSSSPRATTSGCAAALASNRPGSPTSSRANKGELNSHHRYHLAAAAPRGRQDRKTVRRHHRR